MRHLCAALILMGTCVVGIALARAAAEDAESNDKPAPGSTADDKPLLLLDDEPLLLRDEPEAARHKSAGADNSRCHVCHLNLSTEKIAVIHAKEEIGCSDCHGNCDAHIDDESWASGGPGTPPEIMYPRETIDAACRECHDTHDVPAREVLARWQARCPEITDAARIVCTDCHGHHRVNPKLRKAWWDKKTGKPLARPDEGPVEPANNTDE